MAASSCARGLNLWKIQQRTYIVCAVMLVGLEGTISRAYTDILYHLLHGLDKFGAADSTIGALMITYTIVGVPYYNYNGPPKAYSNY